MRINRYIANAKGISRRQADDLIAAGEITVNDQLAVFGLDISDKDIVKQGSEILKPVEFQYLLLNKPIGYVCSRAKQGENPTVFELLPEKFHHLQISGRLDTDSSGLLLLTNDGDFSLHLTHPRYQKYKQYQVELAKSLTAEQQADIEQGIDLDDGPSKLQLDGNDKQWQVTMQQGRNRQIRRTFAAINNPVTKLHRTEFGPYQLADLPLGEYAITDKKEL